MGWVVAEVRRDVVLFYFLSWVAGTHMFTIFSCMSKIFHFNTT